MAEGIRIGALISGGGTNLQAIIDACEANEIDGRLVFVGTDNPGAQGLIRAKKHGIPTFAINYDEIMLQAARQPLEELLPKDFDLEKILASQRLVRHGSDRAKAMRYFGTRSVAEAALLGEMARHPFDLLILAGFMRVLTPYFIDRVNATPSAWRIMNIHPALLPSFPGVDGYGDTYRYGCKVGGCTVHFVDYGEDTGPIIGQKAFEISPQDTLETVRQRGLKLEWKLFSSCIQLFAENRLKVISRTYTLANGRVLTRNVVEIAP